MKRCVRIALVGFSTLEAVGLRTLMETAAEGAVGEALTLAEAVEGGLKGFDGVVATAGSVGTAPDLFLHRRPKLLTVTAGRGGHGNGAGVLDSDSDETDLVRGLSSLVGILRNSERNDGLSDREKEVVRLVAEGHINKEIAEKLCISVNTVITHRKNIASKLGIKSASGLSLWAMMNGVIGERP